MRVHTSVIKRTRQVNFDRQSCCAPDSEVQEEWQYKSFSHGVYDPVFADQEKAVWPHEMGLIRATTLLVSTVWLMTMHQIKISHGGKPVESIGISVELTPHATDLGESVIVKRPVHVHARAAWSQRKSCARMKITKCFGKEQYATV